MWGSGDQSDGARDSLERDGGGDPTLASPPHLEGLPSSSWFDQKEGRKGRGLGPPLSLKRILGRCRGPLSVSRGGGPGCGGNRTTEPPKSNYLTFDGN